MLHRIEWETGNFFRKRDKYFTSGKAAGNFPWCTAVKRDNYFAKAKHTETIATRFRQYNINCLNGV